LGAISACHRGQRVDRVLTSVSLLGVSTPSFWLAMLLMLALGIWWPAFPVSGMRTPFGASGPFDVARHLVLPALSLAVVVAGVIARLMRTTMLSVLQADYLLTARALGTPEGVVRYRHAFSVALTAMVPVIGLQAGFALGGAVYIESVFQWPGIGRLLVDAIGKRDLLLVQGTVVVVAAAYVLINLAADLVQSWLDPRIRA
jgi:peptide/nickel transport system permease protein